MTYFPCCCRSEYPLSVVSLLFVVCEAFPPAHQLLVLPVTAVLQPVFTVAPFSTGCLAVCAELRIRVGDRLAFRCGISLFLPFSSERAMSAISTAQASKSFLSQCDDLLT